MIIKGHEHLDTEAIRLLNDYARACGGTPPIAAEETIEQRVVLGAIDDWVNYECLTWSAEGVA